ncbi:hypothetical protein C8Q77DRAFT_1152036 [Trametes polyzona]|nr:hypothetical protein C8Q77DRAFT_1152036 [Trametes polyzona]
MSPVRTRARSRRENVPPPISLTPSKTHTAKASRPAHRRKTVFIIERTEKARAILADRTAKINQIDVHLPKNIIGNSFGKQHHTSIPLIDLKSKVPRPHRTPGRVRWASRAENFEFLSDQPPVYGPLSAVKVAVSATSSPVSLRNRPTTLYPTNSEQSLSAYVGKPPLEVTNRRRNRLPFPPPVAPAYAVDSTTTPDSVGPTVLARTTVSASATRSDDSITSASSLDSATPVFSLMSGSSHPASSSPERALRSTSPESTSVAPCISAARARPVRRSIVFPYFWVCFDAFAILYTSVVIAFLARVYGFC